MYGNPTKQKEIVRVKPHVKKNDTVLILTGKDRGKQGKVLRVNATKGTAIVEGAGKKKKKKKHTQQKKNTPTQIRRRTWAAPSSNARRRSSSRTCRWFVRAATNRPAPVRIARKRE